MLCSQINSEKIYNKPHVLMAPFAHPVCFGKALQIGGVYNKVEVTENCTVWH
jgi:hypothetical protein